METWPFSPAQPPRPVPSVSSSAAPISASEHPPLSQARPPSRVTSTVHSEPQQHSSTVAAVSTASKGVR
jgi:hypothetical protein